MKKVRILKRDFSTLLGEIDTSIYGYEARETSVKAVKDGQYEISIAPSQLVVYEFSSEAKNFGGNYKFNGVEKGWAFLLQKADDTELGLQITCTLTNPPDGATSGLDTGEHLDSLLIEKDEVCLSIGTEDAEVLLGRARQSRRMPARLIDEFGVDPKGWAQIVTFSKFGLKINVPELQSGENLYFHIICASAKRQSDEDISTHLIVDRSMDDVLARLLK